MWTDQMQGSLTSKQKGDAAFRHNDFKLAIEFYTQFIDVGTMVSPTVDARRSLCYLINNQPQEAMNNAMQPHVISLLWHIDDLESQGYVHLGSYHITIPINLVGKLSFIIRLVTWVHDICH